MLHGPAGRGMRIPRVGLPGDLLEGIFRTSKEGMDWAIQPSMRAVGAFPPVSLSSHHTRCRRVFLHNPQTMRKSTTNLIPDGRSPGQTSCYGEASGLRDSIRARSLHGSLAKSYGADGGQPGERTGIDGNTLRECSVVLTRIREGPGARVGAPDTDASRLGANGNARDPVEAVQTAANPEVGPAVAEGVAGVVICLPFGVQCCGLCGVSIGTMSQMKKHNSSVHSKVPVRYCCSSCGKTSPLSQAIACHVPKCKGHARAAPTGAVQCEACKASFASRRACSIHEMHVHPSLRNMKRIATQMARDGPDEAAEEVRATRALPGGESGVLTRSKRRKLDNDAANGRDMPPKPTASSLISQMTPTSPEGELKAQLRELAREMVSEVGGEDAARIPALIAWLEGSDQFPALVTETTATMLQGLIPEAREGLAPSRRKRGGAPRSALRRRRKLLLRKEAYRRCQHLYKTDPTRLAAEILDKCGNARCPISPRTIYETFRSKWEDPLPFGGLGQFRAGEHASNEHLAGPISVDEVEESLSQASSESAPGPDRVAKRDILEWDPGCETLTRLFNMWWFNGVVPARLKRCCTILFPKSSDPGAVMEIGNWRPITIGSMILRVFTRVLTKRMSNACPLHPSQWGFRPAPGCSENIEILRGLIRHCKTEHSSPLAVVSIDFAQAFDSISHGHLLVALGAIKVDPHVVELIQQLYTDGVTSVEIGDGCTPDVGLKVGVKQGDPLSPLLFNLAMDPLIHSLKRIGKGYRLEGHLVTRPRGGKRVLGGNGSQPPGS